MRKSRNIPEKKHLHHLSKVKFQKLDIKILKYILLKFMKRKGAYILKSECNLNTHIILRSVEINFETDLQFAFHFKL